MSKYFSSESKLPKLGFFELYWLAAGKRYDKKFKKRQKVTNYIRHNRYTNKM